MRIGVGRDGAEQEQGGTRVETARGGGGNPQMRGGGRAVGVLTQDYEDTQDEKDPGDDEASDPQGLVVYGQQGGG